MNKHYDIKAPKAEKKLKVCTFCGDSYDFSPYDNLCKPCLVVQRVLKSLGMKLPVARCPNCGKSFRTDLIPDGYNQKYCLPCQEMDSKSKKPIFPRTRSSRPLKLRFDVFERDNFTCQYCGRTIHDKVKLVVDHVFPKSAGGPDDMDNLVTACEECNIGKGDRLLWRNTATENAN